MHCNTAGHNGEEQLFRKSALLAVAKLIGFTTTNCKVSIARFWLRSKEK